MKVKLVKGKNFRNYIQITHLESINELKTISKIVSRTEYKPFVKSFNKTVSASYLINDTFIPLQFLSDIEREFAPHNKFEIENIDQLNEFYNTDIKNSDFKKLLREVKLPPKYDIWKSEYEYQPLSVIKALRSKVARIKVGTGGGKTLITYLYCKLLLRHIITEKNPAQKILIIVPKKDLVIQTVKAFKEFNQFNEPLIVESVYGGSKRIANADVVVGTFQSLCNYDAEYFDDFFCMIGDEAHTSKAYSIREEIYNKCKYVEYMFGMTATYPEYNTLDYLNIVAMFGRMVHEKSLRQLIDDGNICDIEIHRIEIDYADPEISNISKTFKSQNADLDEAEKLTHSQLYRAEKTYVQNLENRIDLMAKICALDNNHLILVDNRSYQDFIFNKFYFKFTNKKVIIINGDTKDREILFEMMEEENNIICIATYDTFSTGVSVNNIHYVHFPDGGKSMFRVLQGIGRGVRLHANKKKLIVFDYVDKITGSVYLKHAKERLKMYIKEQLTHILKKVRI